MLRYFNVHRSSLSALISELAVCQLGSVVFTSSGAGFVVW